MGKTWLREKRVFLARGTIQIMTRIATALEHENLSPFPAKSNAIFYNHCVCVSCKLQ